ncbi:hypothetical protein QWY16_08760 [Planococcus shenhongbingii]|uniref:DUF3221 domain-containing protein n=1 Tax=Planococcus shenhongbingii TaxID=3058398 RepID=A0ABT8NCU9_9BACL|nr:MULTISPECIES: hypothetical protein [unclassified Planococcus (in: firmicutes)]MDN7245701.1 hypothetical protein [Planococcus sp. N017]WKA60183.1 hypothetical protein QWY16_08760 [Planococcus sp. N016]
MKKLSLLMASLLFLAACSNDKAAEPVEEPKKQDAAVEEQDTAAEEQQELSEEGFITQVTANQILVNNIYFTIPKDAKVSFKNGTDTTDGVVGDIRTGMKVSVDYTGPVKETFPMEAEAQTVSILNDEASAEQSEALLAYIEGEQLSSLVILGQPIVRDNEIGFLFNNMIDGEMTEVRVNLDTHEYTVGGE